MSSPSTNRWTARLAANCWTVRLAANRWRGSQAATPAELPAPVSGGVASWGARVAMLLGLAGLLAASLNVRSVVGQEPEAEPPAVPERLFEQEPFDEIEIKDKMVVLRVQLLPIRKLPINPKPTDKLIVRKLDDPTQDYELEWRHVLTIRFFEDMVLAEALGQIEDNEFDHAYEYFQFLLREYPKVEGLDAARCQALYAEAMGYQALDAYPEALALLNEQFAIDPVDDKLEIALGAATTKLIEQYLAKENLISARALLRNLAEKFPRHATVRRWEKQWTDQADVYVQQARAALAASTLREAQEAITAALGIWPDSADARGLAEEIYRKYPHITVGVLSQTGPQPAQRLIDWAARRTERLEHRYLLEFAGAGPEGGEYKCPFGTVTTEEVGRRLVFQLRPNIPWSSGDGEVTGSDLARVLWQLADRRNPQAQPAWADLFAGIDAPGIYEIGVDLRRTHVRPEALLQIPLVRSTAGGSSTSTGGYTVLERDDEKVRYVAQPDYFAAVPSQPQEIVERLFRDGKSALRALRQGEIRVLDRINPWEVDSFANQAEIIVGQYSLPTVHCLIANTRKPLLANKEFRRAILYGLNRDLILRRHVLRNKVLPGCQLVSGPFPAGEDLDDPLRYAYDVSLEPREYNPSLALALSGVGLTIVNKPKNVEEVPDCPPLKLAYPPNEVARAACTAMQKHLAVAKIPLELVELASGATWDPLSDYDLFYVEVMIKEPVVEARQLLGADGLAGACSPYVTRALKELDGVTGWKEARQTLYEIHHRTFDDCVVMPLWQLTEYFAYHQSLQGLGKRPSTLYETVEQWQTSFQLPGARP